MFVIGIEKARIAELAEGKASRINGHDTTLRCDGDYLIYKDEDGKVNRCRILMVTEDEELFHFTCASHGQDDERHLVVTLDGEYVFENGELVTS